MGETLNFAFRTLIGLTLVSCLTSQGQASDVAFVDTLEVCGKSQDGRARSVQSLVSRGWKEVSETELSEYSDMLFDGDLAAWNAGNEMLSLRQNAYGQSFDFQKAIKLLKFHVNARHVDVLVNEAEVPALLLIWGSNGEEKLFDCELYSPRSNESDELFATLKAWPKYIQDKSPNGTSFRFSGDGLQKSAGMVRFMEILGILPEPPVSEPQLGFMPALVRIYRTDEVEFVSHLNRQPSVELVLRIDREARE